MKIYIMEVVVPQKSSQNCFKIVSKIRPKRQKWSFHWHLELFNLFRRWCDNQKRLIFDSSCIFRGKPYFLKFLVFINCMSTQMHSSLGRPRWMSKVYKHKKCIYTWFMKTIGDLKNKVTYLLWYRYIKRTLLMLQLNFCC